MKLRILEIFERLGIQSNRTKNITKHIFVSFFYKGGAVISNFLLVPLFINYLDTDNYGVWLTLTSVIGWFTFFDVGLGNGLRNRLSECNAKGDFVLAKSYVSTAYFTVAIISVILFSVFLLINNLVDWYKVFNTTHSLENDLKILMPIMVLSFCLQLVAKLIGNVYLAYQNHSIQVKIHFMVQVFSLISIWVLMKTQQSSFVFFGALFSFMPLFVLLILNFLGFSMEFKDIKPSLRLWRKEHLKDIMGVGVSFFVIQVSGIMLFTTDNFIISKIFNPSQVVPYDVSLKYFSIVTMVFTLLVTPYWSSFTEAFVKKEYDWIKKSVKNIVKIWCLVPFILIVMLFLSNWFYSFWVGEKVEIPLLLSISMAIYALLFTFRTIFNFFINGVGKIRVQMILGIVSIIINIPLSILFAKTFGFGLSGVILATCISVLLSVIFGPIQYNKIINLKAKGVWNL